ncbi:MAG: DNA translocase FtsK 4TM domain-containing protein [Planctomycetes bacterium]|nr:DNA translocase FtsK 4TM domain-containing protein [Planctomycetota bacterium]
MSKSGKSEASVSGREKIRELAALAFVLAAFFVFVSLVTYDPGDIAAIKYPPNNPVFNKGGRIGAALAYFLYANLGLAAHLVAFLTAFWSFMVFFRRKTAGLTLKIISVVIAVLAAATLLSLQPFFSALTGTAPGAGGAYGKAAEIVLVKNLGGAGAALAVVLAFALSIVLATDWMLCVLFARAFAWLKALSPAAIERRTAERESRDAEEARREIVKKVAVERRKLAEIDPPKAVDPRAPTEKFDAPTPKPLPVRPAPKDLIAVAAKHSDHKPAAPYEQPPIDTFDKKADNGPSMKESEIRDRMAIIENTLRDFRIESRVVNYEIGPATTTYELELAPGTACHSVSARANELSMKLQVPPVRVVAPIPGKGTVGVEVPNPTINVVRIREFLDRNYADLRKIPLPLLLGKTNSAEPIVKSLAQMPHLLIGGSTGSGKSVCLNAIITSMLCGMSWDEMKLILIDPKMVELSIYRDIPHLWAPVVTDSKKAAQVLEWLVKEMEDRYRLLSRVQVRDVDAFNRLGEKKLVERLNEAEADEQEIAETPRRLPYIVVVIDELANLMHVARKEVETTIALLAAKARAIGIHLVCATQRPSTDVVTGLIKTNLPSRICFRVASAIDSRIILDHKGGECLLGKGDMLTILPPDYKPWRGQCTYVSDDEIRGVVQYLKSKAKPVYHSELVEIERATDFEGTEDDDLFEEAVRIVLEEGRGSTSLLQRRLEIGYSRAARLVDAMEKYGVVGGFNKSNAREVLVSMEEWEARKKAPQRG